MKVNKTIYSILVMLIIVLISVVSIFGINLKKKNAMKDILPNVKLGTDLEGTRNVSLKVNESEVGADDKDSEENKDESSDENKEKELVNPMDKRNVENYKKSKEVYEKRFESVGLSQYDLRLNESTGKLDLKIAENDSTDQVLGYLGQGKFKIVDSSSNETLLDNSNLKDVKVGYSNQTAGTYVYVSFILNDESKEKFKEITQNHLKSTDDQGNDNSSKVKFYVDDSELIETAFSEVIEDGQMPLSIGKASTDQTEIEKNVKQATLISTLIRFGETPIKYDIDINRYVASDFDITNKTMLPVAIVAGIAVVVMMVVLSIINPKLAIRNIVLFIGYVSLLILAMRATDIVITIEGVVAFIAAVGIQYLFMILASRSAIKDNEKAVFSTLKENVLKLIPLYIFVIICIFFSWEGLASLSKILFWGLIISAVYNVVFTRTLYKNAKQ